MKINKTFIFKELCYGRKSTKREKRICYLRCIINQGMNGPLSHHQAGTELNCSRIIVKTKIDSTVTGFTMLINKSYKATWIDG